jgi:hypothetical protein
MTLNVGRIRHPSAGIEIASLGARNSGYPVAVELDIWQLFNDLASQYNYPGGRKVMAQVSNDPNSPEAC